jgi:membrane-associated phospholipid phosphatase
MRTKSNSQTLIDSASPAAVVLLVGQESLDHHRIRASMNEKSKLWAESAIGVYWAVTAAILVSFGGLAPSSLNLALSQLMAAGGILYFAAWCDARPGRIWIRFLPWPVALMWTYKNVDMVQKVLGLPLHDAQLQAWDQALWGFSPAWEWSRHWEWLWFSEFLHFCYATYMLNFALAVARQVGRHGMDVARQVLGGGVLALILCYCGNCLYPALGPRPLLPPLAEPLQGPFWRLCHFLCKDGAAAAAAFPSGHCALSTATMVLCWRWDRRFFPICALWSVGTICSTVYGRFHYSVDSIAGVGLGCLAAALVSMKRRG